MHDVYTSYLKRTLLHLRTDKRSIMYVHLLRLSQVFVGFFQATNIISWSLLTTLPQFLKIIKASLPFMKVVQQCKLSRRNALTSTSCFE